MNKTKYSTLSGLPIKDYYDSTDAPNLSAQPPPGQFPYTRGIHKNMYRGKLWTMRQYAGFGSAQETNKRYRYLMEQGTTGLSVAFDLPTQMGKDPDNKASRGEVGRVGVSIASVKDMEILFEEIPLDKVSISMTINATAPILLAFLLVVAENKKIPWESLKGTIQNDVLKEYIARGTYIYPPLHALRLVTDVFRFCADKVPNWNTISISGYHMREAGSTAAQELAFTILNGITYVEAALKAGLDIDDFAPRLAFFFNCHIDFLEEVAKFRAARRMWANIMKDRFHAKKPESMALRFHTQTAGSSLTAQQPYNNIVRTTIQALAAVCGGTQSLHTNSYDEALGLPSEEAALIALRTQQIIAYESGVAGSADPFAGSFLIENWTDRLEKESLEIIDKVGAMGGMLKAIELGFPQNEIHESAYQFQLALETGDRTVVGQNNFKQGGVYAGPAPLSIDNSAEKLQIDQLELLRTTRDKTSVKLALLSISETAKNGGNLLPEIINAARVYATLGEISDALRGVFGEYIEGSV